jgi:hypothetical protein
MIRNQYVIFESLGRISGAYNGRARRDVPVSPEGVQARREWTDPKKRAEKEREGDMLMERAGDCPHHQ